MPANRAALFSYLFGWIGGLVFLFIERKNRLVRFSAAQSLAFFGSASIVLFVIHFVGGFLGAIPLIGFVFGLIFSILNFVVIVPVVLIWLFLMFRAYQGATVRLPFFGDYAERIAARFGGKDAI